MLRDGRTRSILAFALLVLGATSLRSPGGSQASSRSTSKRWPLPSSKARGCTTLTGIEVCGDQQSEPFRIAGQSFKTAFEADNPGETGGYAFFNVIDENDGIVLPDSQGLSSDSPTRVEGEVTFSSGPGEYVIEIASEKASYALTVENCDGLSAVQTASQRPVALPERDRQRPAGYWWPAVQRTARCPPCLTAVVRRSTRLGEVAPATPSSLRG